MPDFSKMTIREAIEIAKKYSIEVEFSGTGQIYKQEPAKGAKIENLKIKLYSKINAMGNQI